jgi:anti-anti-sigma factor
MTRANGAPSGRHEFEGDGVEVVHDPDATRIVLAGDLDMSAVPRVRPIVEAACASGSEKVELDLSAIEFVDSHGFQLLAATHQALTANGRTLVVLPPRGLVRRAFEVTGFDSLFGDGG